MNRNGRSDEPDRHSDDSDRDAGNSREQAGRSKGSHGQPIDPGIARDLSEIARGLQAEIGSPAVMQRIVSAAVAEIPAAAGAAITLLDHGVITSPAHSDDRARQVGTEQQNTGEGPCVDTARREVTLRADDLRNEPRWPRWAAAAVKHGVQSALSLQLFVEQDSMGALDLYGDKPNAFDDEAEDIGLLLAAHAAVAMAGMRKSENLTVALDSRDVIGQAKGILMERYKISAEEAFQLLVMSSQATHVKLREVATRLADTGELAVPPPRRV